MADHAHLARRSSSGDTPASAPPQTPVAEASGLPVTVQSPSPLAARNATDAVAVPKKSRGRTPKPPKDSKIYKVCMAVVSLRAQGKKGKEVAEILGYPPDTISTYMKRGVRKGWLNIHSFDDPDDRLDFILRDKTVRNINELLDDRDKDVTIEVAKGIGMLKQHQVVKGDTTTNVGLALQVKVELPPAVQNSTITIRPGTVGGGMAHEIPIDAEIVEDGSERT